MALSIPFFNPFIQGANGATEPLVIISETFHREVNGKFTDDSLGLSLLSSGELYEMVVNAPKVATWLIDPQVIEEIIDMSDGYTVLPNQQGAYADVAKSFLELLRTNIGSNAIFALPYGSPNIKTRKKVSDSQ